MTVGKEGQITVGYGYSNNKYNIVVLYTMLVGIFAQTANIIDAQVDRRVKKELSVFK
jgi:hypothetical protein